MTELPEPLVGIEVDLRDFAYMPLDVVRLRDSDLSANQDGEVFRAAVLSWCVSWHQIPAASLPDDDALLARLLGYGRDVTGWRALREAGALHKWIKCSDGRLYHPTVAEKANEAWEAKLRQRDRTAKARSTRLSQHQSQKLDQSVTDTNSSVTEIVTSSKGREGREEELRSSLRSDTSSPKRENASALKSAEVEQAVEAYNSTAKRLNWPIAEKINAERRRKILRRIEDAGGLDAWKGAMRRAEASPFLRGETARSNGHESWRPDLDFFLQESRFTHLIEGKYDPPGARQKSNGHTPRFEPTSLSGWRDRLNGWAEVIAESSKPPMECWPGAWGPADGSMVPTELKPEFTAILQRRRPEAELRL